MESRTRPSQQRSEWAVHARRSSLRLSPSAPLWADTGAYDGSLQVETNVHPGIEVGVILAGQAERHYPDHEIAGVPGDVWLCAMWEPHGWRVILPETDRVVLIFLPEFLGDEMLGDLPWLSLFAAPPSQRPQVSTPEMRRTVLAMGWKLQDDILTKAPGWQTAVRLDLLRLLFDLSRNWQPPVGAGLQLPRPSHLSRIMPALTLLHERGPLGLSLLEAAAACNLGQTRFGLLFRQTMGLSFGRFRLRSRLASAAHLLLTTDHPVDDIAARVGFSDGSHLHRAFVRQYGCTPGDYRSPRG